MPNKKDDDLLGRLSPTKYKTDEVIGTSGPTHIDTKSELGRTSPTKINTTERMKYSNPGDIAKKVAKHRAMRDMARKLGKTVPALGPITTLVGGLSSKDASASEIASDVANSATESLLGSFASESTGPSANTLQGKLERGERLTPEEYEILKQQFNK